jgi:hypothetical protein
MQPLEFLLEGEKGSRGGGAWRVPPSEIFYSHAMVLRECSRRLALREKAPRSFFFLPLFSLCRRETVWQIGGRV